MADRNALPTAWRQESVSMVEIGETGLCSVVCSPLVQMVLYQDDSRCGIITMPQLRHQVHRNELFEMVYVGYKIWMNEIQSTLNYDS
jgi:hypothetical protein